MSDLISRQAVRVKLTELINEMEEIFSHIREINGDDSVCGLCEYDGAYIGQSGDWCNECPGFDSDKCFKLKDKYREEWTNTDELPSAQSKGEMSEFKEGQYIIYHNESTNHYELGRIKTLTENGAFVAYHSGETGAKTPYDLMHPLINEFVIQKTMLGGLYFDE